MPHLSMMEDPDGRDWLRCIVLFRSLDSCDLAYLATLETAVRSQPAP